MTVGNEGVGGWKGDRRHRLPGPLVRGYAKSHMLLHCAAAYSEEADKTRAAEPVADSVSVQVFSGETHARVPSRGIFWIITSGKDCGIGLERTESATLPSPESDPMGSMSSTFAATWCVKM